MNYDIRFSCPKCGQHLACEPVMQGVQIDCPACKQKILIVTEKIRACYGVLELTPGSPLDQVQQAHREHLKNWDPDLFPDDPQFKKTAGEKSKALNDALSILGIYLAGNYSDPRLGLAPARVQGPPVPVPAPKPAPATEAPAPKPAPAKPAPAAAISHPALQGGSKRSWLPWVLFGSGVAVLIAAIVGVFFLLLHRPPALLTNDSTAAQWVRASEGSKHAYSHAVLVHLEQSGVLKQFHARVNDAFFYEGLENIARQRKQEDLDSKLVDLCTKLVEEQSAPR
jgi:hypothetical protein